KIAETTPAPQSNQICSHTSSFPTNGFNNSLKIITVIQNGSNIVILVKVQAKIAFFKSEYPLSDKNNASFNLFILLHRLSIDFPIDCFSIVLPHLMITSIFLY